MCTAISYTHGRHYFGRNLDLELDYGEAVVTMPRNVPLHFRRAGDLPRHHAMIGMAALAQGYPLYFDAVNEHGLAMAGLNFPRSARYFPPAPGRDNLAPFELIPWVLGKCATLAQAADLLKSCNLAAIPFSRELPLTPLHWLLADQTGSLAVESTCRGLELHPDPVGVLTNEPPFPGQMHRLQHHLQLSPMPPENKFAPDLALEPDSRGMGALGLPGDWSSGSRFVRAAFLTQHSPEAGEGVAQFFHLLAAVAMPRGAVQLENGAWEITRYSSCCDTAAGIYYYTTYENPAPTAVLLSDADLESSSLRVVPLVTEPRILVQEP